MQFLFGEETFDVTASIAFMYLWMFFAFFTILSSCELQELATKNIYVKHAMAFIAFFFLITIVDSQNNQSVQLTWLKTLIVYLIFVVTTKMTLFGIMILLGLLLIDLTLRAHIQYRQKQGDTKEQLTIYLNARVWIRYLLFTTIIFGFLHYLFYQEKEYQTKFSLAKFLLGTGKCHHM
jgi:quinol-cytochrome oxidoreductase complex cytochrome b subunit